MSQWVGDIIIDTNNHVTNSLYLLHKIQVNLDLSYMKQAVEETWIFYLKTVSSHTSQNN